METKLPQQVSLSPEVLFQELDNEAIMLNLHDEHYYSLNEVGTRLWQLFIEHNEVETVVAHMLTEYAVEESQLRADIAALLEQLAAAKMVTVTG